MTNTRLDKAFDIVDRSNFLPENLKAYSKLDQPLSISHHQTNSQPSTVKLMLGWLGVQEGDKILDVGSGSGWTSALLANLTGKNGRVIAIERIPDLMLFGKDNCEKLGIKNIEFVLADGKIGYEKEAPYDRILVSAAAKDIPISLLGQLKIGGKLVIPIRNDILEITKRSDDKNDIVVHPGFIFVPLV